MEAEKENVRPTCNTCDHWSERDERGEYVNGVCRRHSPGFSGAKEYWGDGPVTHDNYWCGEHSDREGPGKKQDIINALFLRTISDLANRYILDEMTRDSGLRTLVKGKNK